MSRLSRPAAVLAVLLIGLTAARLAAQVPRTGADSVYAFSDVHVLHMTGVGEPVLRNQTVLVRYGEIERVGPVGEVQVPVFYERIEGDGRLFLIPGMTDAHVHLRGRADRWMAMFLANGVTTVFNLAGGSRHLELRDLVEQGVVLGPRIYTTGPFTNLPRIRTPDDAEAEVRQQAQAGYDFVKVHGNFDDEAYARLNEVAREVGIPVIGHAPRNLPFEVVTENRMAMVAHAEELIYTDFRELDTTRIAPVAGRMAQAGTWLTPTLSTFHNIVELWGDSAAVGPALARDEARLLTPGLHNYWTGGNPYKDRDPEIRDRIAEMYEFQLPLVRRLYEAGVPMLAGTDAPLPVMYPGWSLHDEVEELVAAGLPMSVALESATRNPGEFVRRFVDPDARFGFIETGARADLVLIAGDPLEELDLLRRPLGVMVRGRWLDRETIDALLGELAEFADGN